jgi:hypothetical protein
VGFSSPLFLLGLGSGGERAGLRNPLPIPYGVPGGEEQAGFRSALPLPQFGADAIEQAGFRSALPLPQFGADAIEQAGYVTPLPIHFGYTGEPIAPPPVEIIEVGGGDSKHRQSLTEYQQRLVKEDREVLDVIIVAMQVLQGWEP